MTSSDLDPIENPDRRSILRDLQSCRHQCLQLLYRNEARLGAIPMTTMSIGLPLKFLWLELTEKCNLVCEHCYNDSSPQKPLVARMREEDWINAISQGAKQGVTDIQFIGGEPLLVKYIDRLI